MIKKVFKEHPERVLGALTLFVAGLAVFVAFFWGTLGSRSTPAESIDADSASSVIININTASEDELTNLDGVSDVIAERIVRYRKENGNFRTVDDLEKVEGIGKEKIKNIRNYVIAE